MHRHQDAASLVQAVFHVQAAGIRRSAYFFGSNVDEESAVMGAVKQLQVVHDERDGGTGTNGC